MDFFKEIDDLKELPTFKSISKKLVRESIMVIKCFLLLLFVFV